MEKPLVSVIIPCYNSEKYIKETLDSILNQSYPNIEIIVMDGLSKDGTLNILRDYEDKITLVSEKDKGQTNAINKGFKMAKGEFIGWIGSDDILLPHDIDMVVNEFLKDSKLALVYGDIQVINEESKVIGRYSMPNITREALLHKNPSVVQPGSFFRKTHLDICGPLNEDLVCVMDYDIWLRILEVGEIKYIPTYLAQFRLHDDSKTVSILSQFNKEIIKIAGKNGIKWYETVPLRCRWEIFKGNIKTLIGRGKS
ncbi:glycosyltransferase family 2 protein [Clostridium sp.]|uniref:glycosyltransferase family 2 protein n=1 Tax=Clostridium sp. TaxID=1506 RepID=UPI00346442DC